MSGQEAREALEQAILYTRGSHVAGTPEKYPGTKLWGFRLLDAEALASRLSELEQALREIERMAGAAGYGETPAKPIAERARAALAGSPAEEQTRTPTRCNDVHSSYGRCALIAGHAGRHSIGRRDWANIVRASS